MKVILVDASCLALAEAALDEAEQAIAADFRFEKRRKDWLLGRYAAKLAVQEATGLPPNAIAIRSQDNGQPHTPQLPAGWTLSITHSHDHAVAICAPGPIGIDLELMRPVAPNGWRFFLSAQEREWLAGSPLGLHGEIIAWSVKEAAYKALGGATESLLALRLDGFNHQGGWVHHEHTRWAVNFRVGERFCLAIATAQMEWLASAQWPVVP